MDQEAQFSQIPAPYVPYSLRGSKISDVNTRSDLIRELSKHIPENEYGLPQYYYRPDMLDKQVLIGSMERQEATFVDEMLQAAICQVNYDQGFPGLSDGTPVWGQLPWEGKESYDLFTMYLDQDGIRRIDRLNFEARELVVEYYNLNYWFTRAKSYDLFRAAHHSRLREQRIMNLEDNHWVEGERLVRRLFSAIGRKNDEELDKMEVDKLISSVERAVRIQRAAVGRGMNGDREGDSPKATSVEIAMKTVATVVEKTEEQEEFDLTLLQNPELITMAQELIIKVNK